MPDKKPIAIRIGKRIKALRKQASGNMNKLLNLFRKPRVVYPSKGK